MKTFISYATEYDTYEGHRNWSDLTPTEQDEIIRSEIIIDSEPEEVIMRIGLRKEHAKGLRGILVYNFIIAEKENGKNSDLLSDEERQQSVQLLEGTAIGVRLAEAFVPLQHASRCHVNDDELESFAQRRYDYLLDLPPQDARRTFLSILLSKETLDNEKTAQMETQSAPIAKSRSILERLFMHAWPEQQVLNALDELRVRLSGDDIYVSNALADTIKAARALVNNEKKKIRETMKTDYKDTNLVALKAIYHVSSNAAASGQFHAYRGVLSGNGRGYLKIAQSTLRILLTDGFIDASEHDAASEDLFKAVKDAG